MLSTLAKRPVLLWSKEGLALYLLALTKLDDINPQLAARLLGALSRWYTLKDDQKAEAYAELQAFKARVHSKNVLELAERLLASA